MSTAGGKRTYEPDFKNPKAKKDKGTMKSLHAKGGLCVICGSRNVELHHVRFRSQGGSDVPENLVMLCSDCHLMIHAENKDVRKLLGQHIAAHRPDIIAHIKKSMGEDVGAEWLKRRLSL